MLSEIRDSLRRFPPNPFVPSQLISLETAAMPCPKCLAPAQDNGNWQGKSGQLAEISILNLAIFSLTSVPFNDARARCRGVAAQTSLLASHRRRLKMATRFVFNSPIDPDEFDRNIALTNHPEHRISTESGATRIDALTVATDDETESLVLQQELSRLFGLVTVERNVPLDVGE